jgi:hypothetical protein
MAIGFERRQASLIGAGDLPMARLQASVPDLSGLQGVANAFMRAGDKKRGEDDQKKKQDELLAGMREGSKFVGRDENGQPVPLTLPDGSPSFRQGYLTAAESNLDARFRAGFSSQMNDIQRRVTAGELNPEDASDLMRAALEGAVEASDPAFKSRYFEYGAGEITQRVTLMTSQQANRDADLLATGLNDQIKIDIEKAAAGAAAGLPIDEAEARIMANIDTLVALKRVPKATAEIQKQGVRQVIAGQALTSRLARDLNAGLIDPDDMDRFALGIESGDEFDLLVPVEDEMGRPGRATAGFKTTQVIGKITDDRLRASISQKLREAATDYRQRLEVRAKNVAFAEEFARLGKAEHRFDAMSPGMRDDAELFVQRIITEGRAFEDDGSMALLMTALQRTKIAPKGLVSTLRNMTNSGDEKQIEKAIQVYQMMTTLQNEWGDQVGRAIYADMPEDDRDTLDAFRDAYEFGVPAMDIREAMRKLRGKDAISIGDAISHYNKVKGGDEATFNKEFTARWQEDFEGSFPLDASDAFRRAYRMNLAITGDAAHAFDKAYAAVSGRYTASDIFVRGVEKTGLMPPVNPYGYEASRKTIFGGNAQGAEYEWLENEIRMDLAGSRIFEGGGITKAMLADLLNQPNDPSTFNAAFGWTSPDFLGRTVKLEPTGTSPTQPEFMLRMYDAGGNDMGYLEVEGPDGVERPYTINPWQRHTALTQRAVYQEKRTKLEVARENELAGKKDELWQLYNGQGAFIQPAPQTDEAFQQFLETVEPAERDKYLLDRDRIEKGFDLQMQKLEETGGIDLSKSRALDQTSLVMPRAAGFDVTANAVAAVDAILPDGTGGAFMMRVAAQESNFGKAGGTFRPRGDRGIFQVNTSSGFVEVINQARSGKGRVYEAAQKLKNSVLGIDVANLTPADLDKPVVAAAVGRLYFLVSPRDIPQDVAGQARLWKDHYNTYLGSGTVDQFIRSAGKVPDGFSAAAYLTADQG